MARPSSAGRAGFKSYSIFRVLAPSSAQLGTNKDMRKTQLAICHMPRHIELFS